MEINIPKNDYVQPTEVRQKVVQAIIDTLLPPLNVYGHTAMTMQSELYFYPENVAYGKARVDGNEPRQYQRSDRIRIRGCEIQAVLDAFINAGYNVYSGEYHGAQRFVIYKKPVFGTPVQRVKLNQFID